MDCGKLVILIIIIFLFVGCIQEGYTDYKVYGESKSVDLEFPYEQPYEANNFPLSPVEDEPQETAPWGACLIENALWSCSL